MQETGAYEARMFCEMLLKGAVNIVEVRLSHPMLSSYVVCTADIICRRSFL